jgi:hypothetical protein
MHDNGFTKVPNAIIRSSVLSIAEKAVWCYIASMPNGYRYSVRSACKTLHIGDKIWRRAIIKLEKLGLISVRHALGMATVYEASKDAFEWNVTPSQMTRGSNDTPSQLTRGSNDTPSQLTTPPLVNGQQVTHINKKELLNNNVDDDTCAHIREKFEHEVMIDGNIELACMSCGITQAQYTELAAVIIAEWKFKDLPNSEWTKNHFISVLRHKVNSLKFFNHEKENSRNSTTTSNPLSNATIHTANIG